MMTGRAFTLSVLCGALGLLPARPSLAAEGACARLTVEADAALLGISPELPEQIHSALAQRDGIDTCARVRLGQEQRAIRVEVTLADGRSAARSVTRSEDIIPVLEALLLVPTYDTPASTAEESAPPSTVAARAAPRAFTERDAAGAASESSWPDWGVELSVVGGARFGDHQTSVGLGVLSLIELWGWLVGFEGRASSYGGTTGEPQGALQLGALGGRRFHFENVALDLLAGPALALQGDFATETTGPAGTSTETSSPVEPRLLFAGHLSFASRSALRGFVGIEGEIGLAGAPAPDVQSSPAQLPRWMLGLALGGTVGTR